MAMALQRVVSKGGSCSGCYFHIEERVGGLVCKQALLRGHATLDCVDFDEVNPSQLVHYIFKESCNEKQNEAMAS
jgi:hypothetical protein